jgi:hypothetical protein
MMPQLDLMQGLLHPSEHPLSEDAKKWGKVGSDTQAKLLK